MKKTIGYSMVAVQFFAQISPTFAGVFQADEQSVAQTAVEAGRVLQGSNSGDAARQLLTSQASGQAADAVTQWLNQFGTAKTQLSVDSDFSLKGSSLDVLLPFYNTPKNVLFTQLGMRDNDGRFTTNAGLGHRHFMDNGWMLGYNVFYDVDWRNTNRRYGIGMEAWRDYLKLSANGYKRLSDWRQSPTVTDYDERPADGWDTDADGQTVTLNMGSNWFAQSATKYEWLNSDYDGTAIYSCRQLGAQVASSGALQGIISEWGELETYEGWTNLKNNWLYSSTTVVSGNGVKSTIAYLFPGGKEGLLTGIRGYYACR